MWGITPSWLRINVIMLICNEELVEQKTKVTDI